MALCIYILSDMFFLSASSHSLHLFKLLARGLFHLICWLLLDRLLRSNLILLLLWWLLFLLFVCWLLFWGILGSRLLVQLLIVILGLVSGTYKRCLLVGGWSLRGIPLVLVKISWLLGLQTLLSESLSNGLPLLQAEDVSGLRILLQLELTAVVYRLIFW